jgi:hypothetical protein
MASQLAAQLRAILPGQTEIAAIDISSPMLTAPAPIAIAAFITPFSRYFIFITSIIASFHILLRQLKRCCLAALLPLHYADAVPVYGHNLQIRCRCQLHAGVFAGDSRRWPACVDFRRITSDTSLIDDADADCCHAAVIMATCQMPVRRQMFYDAFILSRYYAIERQAFFVLSLSCQL